jgi:hypothetical protein
MIRERSQAVVHSKWFLLITTLIVVWLVEIAQGHSGSPYDWLCAIGGLAYLLAAAFFRWRG